MKEIKQIFESNIWLRVLTIASIVLIIAGFLCPPLAKIDGSVLTACGELGGFGALWIVLLALEKGIDTTVKHGNTEITMNNPDKEDK